MPSQGSIPQRFVGPLAATCRCDRLRRCSWSTWDLDVTTKRSIINGRRSEIFLVWREHKAGREITTFRNIQASRAVDDVSVQKVLICSDRDLF